MLDNTLQDTRSSVGIVITPRISSLSDFSLKISREREREREKDREIEKQTERKREREIVVFHSLSYYL
jgi:hypothetical protein